MLRFAKQSVGGSRVAEEQPGFLFQTHEEAMTELTHSFKEVLLLRLPSDKVTYATAVAIRLFYIQLLLLITVGLFR